MIRCEHRAIPIVAAAAVIDVIGFGMRLPPLVRRRQRRAAADRLLRWQLGSVVYPATWSFWAATRFGWTPGQIGWSLGSRSAGAPRAASTERRS